MDYISTRGSAPTLDFRAATLAGLASDGGLYVPAAWPQMSAQDIRALAGLDYAETAVRVMMPFVAGVLDEAELRELCRAAYGRFSHDAVTPLVQLDHRHWLLELFHGPTLAFKDVALQLLGQLFEKFLSGGDTDLTIVGATSGDTGSAAIEAVAGREHIHIFMLHPEGRVSDVQRRQMTTVLAPNVHNIAIDGSFDDAQAMVKRLFGDAEARSALTAQVVYYFDAAVRLGAPDRAIAFSVPTGNFGDVFAGYVAARMGLPVARLVVATNVNDILHRALSSGDYSAGSVTATATPSMDIQVSSNFERLLFDLAGRDGAAIDSMMAEFDRSRAMTIPEDMLAGARDLFSSARIDADGMTLALRWAQEHGGQIIDPHSAVGLAAARALDIDADVPVVTLATAHPAKFRDAVERATGVRPALPTRLGNLFDREERYEKLPGDYDAVKAHILREAARG
jgi:threonine synthase